MRKQGVTKRDPNPETKKPSEQLNSRASLDWHLISSTPNYLSLSSLSLQGSRGTLPNLRWQIRRNP
jgi:hypothetical protein